MNMVDVTIVMHSLINNNILHTLIKLSLSYSREVMYSRGHKNLCFPSCHKISLKIQPHLSFMMTWQYWLGT